MNFIENSFSLASDLTDPVCKAHEYFRRTYTVEALHPTATRVANVVRKFFLVIAALLFSCLALFTTLPGIALRGLAAKLQNTPFLEQHSRSPSKTLPPERIFTLLSWNICCVAGGYTITDGGVVPWKERIDQIVRQIEEKDADVNCIYETMDTKSALYVADRLKAKGYPHIYFNMGSKAIGVSAGILVASKYEVKEAEFIPFPLASLVGRTKNASKGVFGFDLASEGKSFARIFATHLQHSEEPAFPTEEERAGRRMQMEIIVDKVNRVRDKCVVVTGDLNLDDEEYLASPWRSIFQKGDAFSGRTWGGDAFCASLVGKRPSGPLNLDHTMIVQGTARAILTQAVDTGYVAERYTREATSDHRGLYSLITL
jgi:endonuclease/exonuclease/phosphatase family metal-dependent hydrolase